MMRLRGRHYRTTDLIDVLCDGGRIASVEPASSVAADATAEWIAPALFDLQVNGGGGIAFGSPSLTTDEVHRVVELCRSHGISGLCPTLITGSFEDLHHGFATLSRAGLEDALPCYHLEGPYLSPEDGPRGAHPREHVRRPDRDEFLRWQDAACGRIRLVTIAPEVEGARPFIEWLTKQGVVVAIGHTAAAPPLVRDAVKAGARLSTHLGNGSHAMLPRHENYLWEQLACDDLWASVITDGHHLPAAVVRCVTRVKTAARLIVTCDASSLAGLPPGRYQAWGQELEVRADGRVGVCGTPFLAGSGVFTDVCLAWLLRLGELSLAEAIDCATRNPRALLQLPAVDLVAGSPADVVLFDQDEESAFRVRRVVTAGR